MSASFVLRNILRSFLAKINNSAIIPKQSWISTNFWSNLAILGLYLSTEVLPILCIKKCLFLRHCSSRKCAKTSLTQWAKSPSSSPLLPLLGIVANPIFRPRGDKHIFAAVPGDLWGAKAQLLDGLGDFGAPHRQAAADSRGHPPAGWHFCGIWPRGRSSSARQREAIAFLSPILSTHSIIVKLDIPLLIRHASRKLSKIVTAKFSWMTLNMPAGRAWKFSICAAFFISSFLKLRHSDYSTLLS